MRTALFLVTVQGVVVISYRRFGTTYLSCPHGSRIHNKACSPQIRSVYREECGRCDRRCFLYSRTANGIFITQKASIAGISRQSCAAQNSEGNIFCIKYKIT